MYAFSRRPLKSSIYSIEYKLIYNLNISTQNAIGAVRMYWYNKHTVLVHTYYKYIQERNAAREHAYCGGAARAQIGNGSAEIERFSNEHCDWIEKADTPRLRISLSLRRGQHILHTY